MEKRRKLPTLTKIGFGFGHILNDITATLWFGYGLVYMQDILQISKASAGYVILIAQLTDAFFNLVMGSECDKINILKGYGRRKAWHLLGTFLVVISMIFNYIPPFMMKLGVTPEWQVAFHMLACQMAFNMGWAIIQIAHLSMIPTLAKNEGDDVELNSIRQGNVYFASIIVYVVAGLVIKNSAEGFQWQDRWSIMLLSWITIGIGLLTAVLFHVLTPEEPTSTPVFEETVIQVTDKSMTWKQWFKKPGFWRVCFCYCLTRLVYNMTLLFFPFLISSVYKYPMNYLGYCPLVLYGAGMIFSFAITGAIRLTNKKFTYIFSALLYVAAAIWLEFLKEPTDAIWPISILIGASSSGILVLALAAIVDVVGENQESSGFVYGFYSVLDKTVNGIGAVVIQLVSPCKDGADPIDCTADFPAFYGRMMIVWTLVSLLIYLVLPKKFFRKEEDPQEIMGSIIVSNRFQRSMTSSALVYSLRTEERRPLISPS